MIEFHNVTKMYKNKTGLDNVSINIAQGEFVFLVGPSGAGKSTFIKLIMKEINADQGNIIVGNTDITRLSNRNIAKLRKNIGMVFQDFRLLPNKTVYENVAFAMEIVHKKRRVIKQSVPEVLSLMGIREHAKKYPDELSAGEQQRVAIARAIVNKPKILIADEPTGNLDPATAWEIMKLLEEINKRGTTVVMVTHAKDIVDGMNKRVVAIEKGKIIRDSRGLYSNNNSNILTKDDSNLSSNYIGNSFIEVSDDNKMTLEEGRGVNELESNNISSRESLSQGEGFVREVVFSSDLSNELNFQGEGRPSFRIVDEDAVEVDRFGGEFDG